MGFLEVDAGPADGARAVPITRLGYNTTMNQVAARWFARLAVGSVFAVNVACALSFIFRPEYYTAGFELSGIPGKVTVQGYGILFLMWNVTYPAVILRPQAEKTLFLIILVQQAIGCVAETWMWLTLPGAHLALRATGLRFILFDGAGLVWMGVAYILLRLTGPRSGSLPRR